MVLGTACISSLSIPVNLREILTLLCAVKFRCQYIWSRHIDGAKKEGITASQLQALQDRDLRNPQAWDDKQIAFVFLPEARDEGFREARKWFDDRQIVEIFTAQVNDFPSHNC
jgi:hypothetical protein